MRLFERSKRFKNFQFHFFTRILHILSLSLSFFPSKFNRVKTSNLVSFSFLIEKIISRHANSPHPEHVSRPREFKNHIHATAQAAATITFLHTIERQTVEIGRDTPTNCSKVGGGKSRAFKSPLKSAAINPWSEGTVEQEEVENG